MKRSHRLSPLVLALACPLVPAAFPGVPAAARAEDKVREADVPKPVLERVAKKYPGAVFTAFERDTVGDKVHYQVSITLKEKDKERARTLAILLLADGKILSEEELLTEELLPKDVRKALAASKHGKSRVVKVARVVLDEKDENPAYEVLVADGEKRVEITFDRAGKILEEEDKTPRPKNPDTDD